MKSLLPTRTAGQQITDGHILIDACALGEGVSHLPAHARKGHDRLDLAVCTQDWHMPNIILPHHVHAVQCRVGGLRSNQL